MPAKQARVFGRASGLRRVYRRKLFLLVAITGLAVGVSLYRAGPSPDEGFQEGAAGPNVTAVLAARHRVADSVWLTPTDEAPMGAGTPTLVWHAAREEVGGDRDLYATRMRISAAGIPTVVGASINISKTADGDEVILDADPGRVLYGVRVGGRFESVVLIDFNQPWVSDGRPWASRWMAGLLAEAQYGTKGGATRWDILLEAPVARLGGALDGQTIQLAPGDGRLEVRLGDRPSAEPAGAARVLRSGPPNADPLMLLADVMRASSVVGTDRVMALERFALNTLDWARRQRHRLFPTQADRAPVTVEIKAPAVSFKSWPPPHFSVADGLDGEGTWVPVAGRKDGAILQTFTRVDPSRPYQKTWLFAFDMRALGLHFVAGTQHPRSTTGARGTGRIADAHRGRLVAAFNGGFKAEHGDFGTIEQRRVLVPPSAGLATVVTAPDGHASFGIWDGDGLPRPWTGLRQNLTPLLAGGVINPARSRNWGGVVAELDEARTPRSAMGVTANGVLVYAWSSATSAEHLGAAIARAGVRFAMHLDMNPRHTGLEIYTGGEPRAAVSQMDYRLGRFLGTDTRDFFYLVQAPGNPAAMPHRSDDWAADEGIWRPAAVGAKWVATSYLTAKRVLARRQVSLTLLDTTRLRGHLVPGLAEPKPQTGVPTGDLALPSAPVVWLTGGLPTPRTKSGLIANRRLWRSPVEGMMSLVVAESGELYLGRWGSGLLQPDREWSELLQGSALLEDGHPVDEALRGRDGMPVAAVGILPPGRLVFATISDGDRAALGRALRLAGVREAMLLGAYGTVETGAVRHFSARPEGLKMTQDRDERLVPARLNPAAATSLIFTPRAANARVSTLDSFLEQR